MSESCKLLGEKTARGRRTGVAAGQAGRERRARLDHVDQVVGAPDVDTPVLRPGDGDALLARVGELDALEGLPGALLAPEDARQRRDLAPREVPKAHVVHANRDDLPVLGVGR